MTTEIIFNAHPSLVGGFVAWNHIESETDKHLIIAEGNTFEELAVSARASVALAWATKPHAAPLLVSFRQALCAPEAGILQAGGEAKDLITKLVKASSEANIRKEGEQIAIEGLGPLRGLLVCPVVPLKPESTLLIARTVRNWNWDLRDSVGLERYTAWLKATE